MGAMDYTLTDRLMHRIAFGTPVAQEVLIDLENKLHAERLRSIPITAPVFVTSLPRAGTTVLLEVLSKHPALASHDHRDMPFVLSPVLWRRMTERFHIQQEKRERSHGDGLAVNADSPEAFEEVLWKKHFPEHYIASGITLWQDCPASFSSAFERHIRAVLLSRRTAGKPAERYLSKNNGNIARIRPIARTFSDAAILVPLRDPVDQALSLLKQHRRALASQAADRFTRDYPRDIGHFEFGTHHRPFLFPGMAEVIGSSDPAKLDYWLRYWNAAYAHLLDEKAIIPIDMTEFCRDKPVEALLERLSLAASSQAVAEAKDLLKPLKDYDRPYDADPKLVAEGREIHRALLSSPNAFR